MELTKEIIYDSDLIQNESFKLSYSGDLYKSGSEEVYIVFGFDKDWKNTTYQKMDKCENGFSTTINLLEYNEFNFCFKDSNDNWDNNNASDYHLCIEPKKDSTSDLNALLDDILNEAQAAEKETTPLEESILKIQRIQEKFDEIFADIEAEDFEENTTPLVAEALDLEKAFPEEFTFSDEIESKISKLELTENNVDSTISQIETKEETISSSSKQENTTLALTTTSKHKNIFEFDNLSPWYVFKKRVRLAFYKLIYVLPSFIFGEDED